MARPRKITKAVIQMLEEGFHMGLTDREACSYAGIGASTLYDYCRENPQFSEQKELLKENVRAKAKINIYHAIEEGDIPISKWYLERRSRAEFSTKQEMDISGKLAMENPFSGLTTEDLKKMIEHE